MQEVNKWRLQCGSAFAFGTAQVNNVAHAINVSDARGLTQTWRHHDANTG